MKTKAQPIRTITVERINSAGNEHTVAFRMTTLGHPGPAVSLTIRATSQERALKQLGDRYRATIVRSDAPAEMDS